MNNFVVTTAIKKLLKLKKRFRVIPGGTSASKTFGILSILIDYAIKNPGQEISVVAESIPHLKRGAQKDFLKILRALNRYNPGQWNATDRKYTFRNNSYIEFFSADQEDKLRGARRNVLYVNEANNIPWDAFHQMAIRTSDIVWVDYNPSAIFWANTELVGNPDCDYLVLTYKDNEALSESIVRDIESAKEKGKKSKYWENWWKVYGLGEVGSIEGACIKDWQQIDNLPEEAELLCYGMDFGFSNDPTTLVALYKYNKGYILHELLYKTGLYNSDISRILNSLGIKEVIYADSSDPKSISEIEEFGHLILPAKKGPDSIRHGIGLLNQNEIFVTASSVNLIKELQSYSWLKDKKTGTTLNKPIDKHNHLIDGARYALSMYIGDAGYGEYNLWL